MTERKHRLMAFRDFVKRGAIKEEGVVIATNGAWLDGDQSAEERQSIIDEFQLESERAK
jgi:hypothetical protein